jgi:hypothetical protein
MFSVLRQFFAGGDAVRITDWNGRWEQRGFRFAIRLVTIVWGVTYIAEALLRVGLALQLPPQQVVTLSPILSFGALIVLISWTRRYMKGVRTRFEQGVAA